MAPRLVGVDSAVPRLPASVIAASQGTTAADLAAGAHTHAPADVGLGNVDNTADADKPISDDTQAALDNRVPLSRVVATAAPLTGGGALDLDLLLGIAPFAGTTPGAVPASPGGGLLFLRADGAWAEPPAGGAGGGGLTRAEADALYVNVDGDTMPGPLTVNALAAVAALQVNGLATFLAAASFLVEVDLPQATVSTAPTDPNHIATKAYVDANAGGAVDIDTVFPITYEIVKGSTSPSGVTIDVAPDEVAQTLTLSSNAASAADLDNVFALASSKIDQATADARYVNIAGDTLTGPLFSTSFFQGLAAYVTEVGNPEPTGTLKLTTEGSSRMQISAAGVSVVGDLDAATLRSLGQINGQSLNIAAGPTVLRDTQLNGVTSLEQGPTTDMHAVTKQYADTKAPLRPTVASIAATTYQPVLADESTLLRFTAATAITFTVPTNTTVAYPTGARLDLVQTGGGRVTVAAAGGVTLIATPSAVLRATGSAATLIKLSANTWVLVGDLT